MNTKLFVGIFVPVTLLVAPAFADEKIQWSEVPTGVQKTITEHAGGGKIEEIEKETETVGGKKTTIYEADVKKPDGKKIEIKVGEDGKLIEIDKD